MTDELEVVFERLRSGTVPERGLQYFEVGTDKTRGEIQRQLNFAKKGQVAFKFLRGDYGCGKTFSAQLAINEALKQNFVTSFVVVSENDLRFHKFEELYRKIVSELCTPFCARGALSTILDRWMATVEEKLIEFGNDEDSPEFDQLVLKSIEDDLQNRTKGAIPQDMIRALKQIFSLKQERNFSEAGALISWLGGGRNVSASAKKLANIKGEISSDIAMAYLRGVLEIVKLSGFAGLVVVVDEVETILRSRSDVRKSSLNGIRQLYDDSASFPGLMWIFTGTPEFFDSQRGVKGLQPLHDRIGFMKSDSFVNVLQPQLDLPAFDIERLKQVAKNLRNIYPSEKERIKEKVSDEFIDGLVRQINDSFAGKIGTVPRQFLRRFVTILDLVSQHSDYQPDRAEKIELEPAEKAMLERSWQEQEDGELEGEQVAF